MLISMMDEMTAILTGSSENDFMHESQFDMFHSDSDIGNEKWEEKKRTRCIIEIIRSDLEKV